MQLSPLTTCVPPNHCVKKLAQLAGRPRGWSELPGALTFRETQHLCLQATAATMLSCENFCGKRVRDTIVAATCCYPFFPPDGLGSRQQQRPTMPPPPQSTETAVAEAKATGKDKKHSQKKYDNMCVDWFGQEQSKLRDKLILRALHFYCKGRFSSH